MPKMSIQEQIIPGYELLDLQQKSTFEDSLAGKNFLTLVGEIEQLIREFHKKDTTWNWLLGYTKESKKRINVKMVEGKKQLLAAINQSESYQSIKQAITFSTLKTEFPEFEHLSDELAQELSKNAYAIDWATDLQTINSFFKEEDNLTQRNKLLRDRIALIEQWNSVFFERQEFTKYREVILKAQIEKLSQYFNTLNYGKPNKDGSQNPATKATVFDDLTHFYFQHLELLNRNEMNFIDLKSFNTEQARFMARDTYEAYITGKEFNLDELIKNYSDALEAYLPQALLLINGQPKKTAVTQVGVTDTLSFLWRNPLVERANEVIAQLADAHAFIQATSFSTQNESSFLAMLDLYNYGRYHKQISETKTILFSLMKPFTPLYNEYREIGLFEKNVFKKYVRSLMPILIIVAVLIGISLLFAGIPELALVALFIPGLLVGLGVASLYISAVKSIYKAAREKFYGGPFEIPEFQVNARMIDSFGSREKAEEIRAFYIDELKKCDEIEKEFAISHDISPLGPKDERVRNANKAKRYGLTLEWYDIHSNSKVDYQTTPKIALKSIEEKRDGEFIKFKHELAEEAKGFAEIVTQVTNDLKYNLSTDEELVIDEQGREFHYQRASKYQPNLFKTPDCFKQKATVESLDKLAESVSSPAVAVA